MFLKWVSHGFLDLCSWNGFLDLCSWIACRILIQFLKVSINASSLNQLTSPSNLLKETSEFTTHENIVLYRKSESCHKSRIFGREHEKFVRVVPGRVDEPVCCDESSNSEGPFCFIYSTILKKLSLRLPFTSFERALLTEINVALAQLHPNS